VWQALLLIATARLDQALHLVEARLDDSRQRGLTALVLAWTMIRARALLDAGRLVEARNEAVGVLDLAAELRTSTGYVCEIARYVIGCVGLHIGTPADLDSAREAAARLRTAELPMSRQLGAVLTAQLTVVEKTSDPPGDVTGLSLLPVIFPGSHADAVRLTRLLVEAGDRQQAEALASRLAHLVATHPDFPFLRGPAAHARALLDADPALAATAAALHHDDPRPLVRASALEDTGRMLPSTDRVQAVAHLSEALNLYVTAGADLDATRVRALLRKRGVRRNAASSRPPPDSWTQLTESEYRVAQLVATGSTNRAVAERLHLSPHTVNSHLRRIFSKLGVRSRVELTRIVAEGPRPQPR
jgi:DNA-binding NarL/FixJ family response regulator